MYFQCILSKSLDVQKCVKNSKINEKHNKSTWRSNLSRRKTQPAKTRNNVLHISDPPPPPNMIWYTYNPSKEAPLHPMADRTGSVTHNQSKGLLEIIKPLFGQKLLQKTKNNWLKNSKPKPLKKEENIISHDDISVKPLQTSHWTRLRQKVGGQDIRKHTKVTVDDMSSQIYCLLLWKCENRLWDGAVLVAVSSKRLSGYTDDMLKK